MRQATALAVIAFAITIALIVGNRLSDEALAVLVGIAFGIAASLPVSLGLWIALVRYWKREEDEFDADEPPTRPVPLPPPPVIFMAPPAHPLPSYASGSFAYSPSTYPINLPRDFHIVGEE